MIEIQSISMICQGSKISSDAVVCRVVGAWGQDSICMPHHLVWRAIKGRWVNFGVPTCPGPPPPPCTLLFWCMHSVANVIARRYTFQYVADKQKWLLPKVSGKWAGNFGQSNPFLVHLMLWLMPCQSALVQNIFSTQQLLSTSINQSINWEIYLAPL